MVADDFEPLQCHILFRGINTCFLFCNADLLIDRVNTVQIREQEPAPGTFADNDTIPVHIQLLRSFDVLRLSKDIDRQFKIRELALCYRRKARIFRAGADRVMKYASGNEAVQALLAGKVDCVIIDNEPAKAYVKVNEGLKILDTEYAIEDYAIAISKENEELLKKVNEALDKLIKDGTVKKIVDKYINAN